MVTTSHVIGDAVMKVGLDRLYLSSSSSILIIDDDSIPALKQIKIAESGVETGKQPLSMDFSEAKADTLENLLMYRLKLEVSDNTIAVVVVMFDETTTSLVKCLADSILAAEDQAHSEVRAGGRALWNPPKGHPPLVIRSYKQLSVATPSKPTEEKKHKRVELEDSDVEASFVADTQSGTVDCGNNPTKNHSLANILHSSMMIQSNTIVRRDGRVQSYCGLRLTGIATSIPENKVRNRMGDFIDNENGEGVDKTTVQSLLQMLDHYSALAKAFRMASDWCRSHTSVNVELKLLYDKTNARQYNGPTVSEVAALITNDFGDEIPTKDIIVNKQDSGPKRISELHPSYLALQYPLLFPY
ncbi:hypothetical protein Tco_1102580 [Tanacetum coccineum]